jgi:hypothetical protein
MLKAVGQQLERTKTNPNLTEVLINALDRALAGRPISVGGQFADALRSQEKIGWRSLLQGYWSSDWHDAYRRTYQVPAEETSKDKSQQLISMERWQSQVIRTVWTSMIGLWKIRNDNRYGRDKDTRELARHEVFTNKLKELYQNRDQYPVEVQNEKLY